MSLYHIILPRHAKTHTSNISLLSPSTPTDHKDKSGGGNMEILYILVPSVAIPLAIALLFFFICVCRNNQKSSRPPAPRQPKPVRGQNVEMSMLTTAYKPKVEWQWQHMILWVGVVNDGSSALPHWDLDTRVVHYFHFSLHITKNFFWLKWNAQRLYDRMIQTI